jgi:pyrrolidone-carboxylate peptidase
MVRLRVFLTGFGKFNGVEENPTEQVICRLKEEAETLVPCGQIHLQVLSVDVQCVDSFHRECDTSEGDLMVHLGVHSAASSILIER